MEQLLFTWRYATLAAPEPTVKYGYDKLGQLIRVDDKSDTTAGSGGTTWVYEYDLGGNILSKTACAYTSAATPSGGTATAYAYDSVWKDKFASYAGKPITCNG